MFQNHQSEPISAGDLVAFTAPNTAWVARAVKNVPPHADHLEVRWTEVDSSEKFVVSFSGGEKGPSKVLPRLAFLGPLKPFLTNGKMSKQNYMLLLDVGKEDFSNQQPLKLGEENLPAFSMDKNATHHGKQP